MLVWGKRIQWGANAAVKTDPALASFSMGITSGSALSLWMPVSLRQELVLALFRFR
jgi:hypothetical protein